MAMWRVLAAVSGAAVAVAAAAQPAAPAPRFAHIFADHAVVQRDRPIAVWGQAAAGASVTVRLGERSATATADATGRWRATLPAMAAGGPYTLAVDGGQSLSDIMIGDVFLCGGQSNMEFMVKQSTNAWGALQTPADPDLRYATIPDTTRAVPLADLEAPAKWQRVGPETVGDASAVCYYMARALRKSEKVPIGFINSEWGGTRIESWTSPAALAAIPRLKDGVAAVAMYGRDPAKAVAQDGARREAWWRAHDPDAAKQAAYRNADFRDAGWATLPAGAWKEAGIPALAQFEGAMWLRATLDLSAAQVAAAKTLQLGPIDQYEDTWVNGRFVGGGSVNWAWRHYDVPAGTLHAGRNVVAIRVLGGANGGGLTGAAPRGLELADGTLVPFSGAWRYRQGRAMTGETIAPAPWDVPNSLATLYNGMIAPLAPYGLKLAAWYQGESNAGEAGTYRELMTTLMADWRRTFAAPQLPFFVVQLTSYGKPSTAPGESGWAALREAQAQAVAQDRNAGLAVTIDVGDRFDIHPTQKTVVGERLARLAQVIAYGHPGLRSGPEVAGVSRRGADLVVRYRNVIGGMHTYSAGQAIGFEACAGDACRYVPGEARGDTVVLPGANAGGVTKVRYAWADAPFTNLFDGADLPAAPFERAVE
ncbi:sialate O-acetylesterase [Sphingomonas sp. BE138]|uniref:sialate O-acetylesterase n=1 Tax=Sphingomonas sp. BE138 TaxID=2817845 RepID=UPI0028677EF9|nr:sialate O-acetylesterase [Sphingomonas sp. BE138]MDR6789659.1 sialate O-acetylesterase [Sphingomonas sp. BE138]